MLTPEQIQIIERIDRALSELREIRAAVAGERDAEQLDDSDLRERAAQRAAQMRQRGGRR